MRLTERILKVQPSATLALSARIKAMRSEGLDVVGFGAGEPDFDTPDFIKKEAIQQIEAGFTKYTPASGILELKKAVCEKFQRDNSLVYKNENILIGVGAKHTLYNVMQVLVQKGDEVVLQSPYWVSYIEQVRLSEANPVVIDTTKNNFLLSPEQLEKAISPRTRLLILNSPSNPTGQVYSKELLEKLAEVILKHPDLYVISDEIYEKLVYDGEFYSIANISDEMKSRTIIINGVSKTYAMTGWRIGYVAADKEIIAAMNKLQSHQTSNPTSFCQKAAAVALTSDNSFFAEMKAEFKKRRDYMYERLCALTGMEVIKAPGAFYLFPSIENFFGRSVAGKLIDSSGVFCDFMLERNKVAAVPGSSFGADKYIRLSYALSMDTIKKGLDRIEEFVNSIK